MALKKLHVKGFVAETWVPGFHMGGAVLASISGLCRWFCPMSVTVIDHLLSWLLTKFLKMVKQ